MRRSRVWTMGLAAFAFILIIGITVGLVLGLKNNETMTDERKFAIDHAANTFLMNGEPFQYVAGSFHYFRALPAAWQKRLRTMRAAGLNVLDTYVEWSLHNPFDGVYNWQGIADLEKFISLAQDEGFYVILRPGPYICAERDNGGLPHWLFNKYPNIQMRTHDVNYIHEVEVWYKELMPRMQKYLYGNGGPIIMVQVENEYGVFHACDHDYLNWLRDETEKYVQENALLFTTDIPNERMKCGKIDGVFATTDFGIDRIHEVEHIWQLLREVQPTGPLVNSEFYPGWLTHWQEQNQRRDAQKVADALRKMLEYGASVNFYMFFGGTNFGFTAGANDWGYGNYTPDITSYDYDAVLDEAGGTTHKYQLVRNVIVEFLKPTDLPQVPVANERIAYGQVLLKPVLQLLSQQGRELFSFGATINATQPKSFEELNLYSGLVLYETQLPKLEIDPTLLTVKNLRDRAFVFVNQELVGTLSRENNIYSLPLNAGWGTTLQLLVENQGRINFNVANDTKGIFGAVTVQKLNGEQAELHDWNSTAFALQESQMQTLIEQLQKQELNVTLQAVVTTGRILRKGPVLYFGEFNVEKLGDTYLNTIGWGKGVAYVNGINMGRYWPLAGPQLTLYVPSEALKSGNNTLLLLEYQTANLHDLNDGSASVTLDSEAQLDG